MQKIQQSWNFSDNVNRITCAVSNAGGPVDGSTKVPVIWILDTGVQPDHPDLRVEIDPALAKSFIAGVFRPDDDNGHGTHVAGIAAAKQNGFGCTGVSAGAKVIPLKILDYEGKGFWSGLTFALDHVAANNQMNDVVNLSLGGYGINCETDPDAKALRKLIQALGEDNTFVVMSAGNDAGDAAMNLPGCIIGDNIFTVAAITCQGECAFYSNFGNPPVGWLAVGSNVYSTYLGGQYKIMSGTSMAAAVISGVVHARGAAPVSGSTVPCGYPLDNYKIGKRN